MVNTFATRYKEVQELTLVVPEALKGLLVSKRYLSTLHHELEARVDALHGLLLLKCEEEGNQRQSETSALLCLYASERGDRATSVVLSDLSSSFKVASV